MPFPKMLFTRTLNENGNLKSDRFTCIPSNKHFNELVVILNNDHRTNHFKIQKILKHSH